MNAGRFRKRLPDTHPPRDPWSARLHELNDLVYEGQPEDLYSEIEDELERIRQKRKLSQLLSLAGDCQTQQGDFLNTVATQDRAAELVSEDQIRWFRPVAGAILALLKNVQIAEAQARADAAVHRGVAFHQQFVRQVAELKAQAKTGAPAVVTARPLPPVVIAIRLARFFLLEGEVDLAIEFFQKAILISPNGAWGARIGLGEIALRQHLPQDAKDWAFSALQVGQFHSKTLPAIPVFLEACHQLGETVLDPRLRSGFDQATPTVRDRAMLLIVRSLRWQGNMEWKNQALTWLSTNSAQNPVVAAEFRKLMQAGARIDNDLLAQISTADALLSTPKVSPSEFTSAAKQRTRSSLLLGQEVDLNALIDQASQQFGGDWGGRVAHGLALACMMSRRHDLARVLLQNNLNNLVTTDSQWAKSLWALARMEMVLENYSVAAQAYDLFANSADIPLRYRLQARLKWVGAIIASGDPVSILSVRDDLIAATDQIQDFDLLLDFARQLMNAPHELYDLANDLFARGQALALAQFDGTKDPAAAIGILFRLTRRQVYDFGKYQDALNFWNNLPQDRRDWLWSERSDFWEYLSWLFVAMTRLHLDTDAQTFADFYLHDASTPLEGRLELMHSLATWKIRGRDMSAGMAVFAAMIAIVPMHWQCAEGYYWLALQARKNGNNTESAQYAEKIQMAHGARKGLRTDWKLDCKAALLRSNLLLGTSLQSADYSEEFQRKCLAGIHTDLRKL